MRLPLPHRHLLCWGLVLVSFSTVATLGDDGANAAREAEYAQFALEHPGEVASGQQIFETNKQAQCSSCHRITGKEKSGPNLDGIGSKYSRRELISHLIDPSRSIKQGYGQTKLLLKDGRLVAGRLERATRDAIRLIDAQGRQQNIDRERIEQVRHSDVSLMPRGLPTVLSPQQFADLVAFLGSLTFEDKRGFVGRNETIAISHSQTPVPLRRLNAPETPFENPVWVGKLPGSGRSLVLLEHQSGRIWRLTEQGDALEKELFLDLSDEIHYSNNQGLMCIAFHPQFETNGRYFLEHEVREGGKVKTTIVERRADADRQRDSGAPSRRLIAVEQPAFNHNGGCIAFGPDGRLYAGFGDGGPQRDPNGYSQSKQHLLGSFIRIDVDRQDTGKNYAVPPDNPFVDQVDGDTDVLPEVFAIGFREPWRFSFDPATGELWVGDVGQNKFEEVCLVRAGENHGWNVREGFETFSKQHHDEGATYTDPVFAYQHGLGFSITGGHVYRGHAAPSFHGVYVFGDYNTKRIWGLKRDAGRVQRVVDLGSAPDGIASFGLDHDGELLLVTYDGGLYRLGLDAVEFD